MAARMMELVRELKSLTARKKRGEALSSDDETRRRELQVYLKQALAQSQPPGQANAAVPPPTQMPAPAAAPAMPKPSRQPYVPRKDAFAIDASALFAEAAASDAVERAASPGDGAGGTADEAQPVPRSAGPRFDAKKASQADIDEMEAKAAHAAKANRAQRLTSADEIAELLSAAESAYTPFEDNFYLEQYYGGYADEGYGFVEAEAEVDLSPVDPRELELYRLGIVGAEHDGQPKAVPPGLAFLDDFAVLYQRQVLPSPDDEEEPDSEDPNLLIPGKRKVTVHLLNGMVKRGAIRQLGRGDLGFRLEPVGAGRVEELSFAQVKAIFIHTGRAGPPSVQGRTMTVTFQDRRSVQGVSDDYQPGVPVFSLVPPPGRGQFERIVVNAGAAASIR